MTFYSMDDVIKYSVGKSREERYEMVEDYLLHSGISENDRIIFISMVLDYISNIEKGLK